MNFETSRWRRQAIVEGELSDYEIAARRKRKRLIIGAVVAALVIIAGIFAFTGGDKAATPAASTTDALPSVTVVVPGREQVSRVITATGTLAARRDMPVGIAGEGGLVARVLVEPASGSAPARRSP